MSWIKADGKVVLPGILMMLVMGSVYSYSVFRLSIETLYQVDTSISGLPYTISLLFYALFMGISGKLLQKVPQYFLMLAGIAFITMGWLLAYLSTSFLWLILGYGVLIGTGIGLIYGIPLAIVTAFYSNRKGLYLGVILLGFGLSPLITAPLMQQLVVQVGLQKTFLIMGGLSFFILTGLSFFYKGFTVKVKTGVNETLLNTLKNPSFLILYGLFFMATFIGLSVIGFSSTYAVSSLSITKESAALFVSVFAIFNGLGRIVYGFLSDRYPGPYVMFGSFLTLVLSLASLVIFEESLVAFILAFSIIWFNLGGWLAIAPTLTSKLFGQTAYSRNYGVLFNGYGLSALIGGYSTGILIERNGYQPVFLLLLLVALLGMVLPFFLGDKKEETLN